MSILGSLLSVLTDAVHVQARSLEEEVCRFLQVQMGLLRRGVLHLLIACGLLCVGYCLVLAAAGLVLWGIYAALLPGVGVAGAALITAAIALLLGLIIVLIAVRLNR